MKNAFKVAIVAVGFSMMAIACSTKPAESTEVKADSTVQATETPAAAPAAAADTTKPAETK